MREIITFNEPIVFYNLVIPQNINLSNLKKVPYIMGDDDFPKLKPGEFCQSDDKKSIFCHAQEHVDPDKVKKARAITDRQGIT